MVRRGRNKSFGSREQKVSEESLAPSETCLAAVQP